MKRVRKAAIVESSGSEEDSEDSDFGETLSDKLKRKRLEAGNSNVEKEKSKEKSKTETASSAPNKAREVKSEKEIDPKGKSSSGSKVRDVKEPKPKKSGSLKSEGTAVEIKSENGAACDKETGIKISDSKARNGGPPSESHPWTTSGVVAAELGLDQGVAKATCELLEAGNSLPFIARYRREATGGMGPDMLRQVSELRDSLVEVREKCKKLMSSVEKLGKLTDSVRRAFLSCQTLTELESVNAPFKTGSKASLAERARKLGLEGLALEVLEGQPGCWRLPSLVQPGVQGLATVEEVALGLQHIISDIMVHDTAVVDLVRTLQKTSNLMVESKKAKVVKSKEKEAKEKPPVDFSKFENYFEYKCPVKFIKPHQVLALNRGESLKALSVKIDVPESFLFQLQSLVGRRWLHRPLRHPGREELIKAALEDAYKRLVVPQVQRQTRAALTKSAEEASITVFLENLRALLLAPPHRGHTLLAIDPGFKHGCKLAVLSEGGDLVEQGVIYPRPGEPRTAPASGTLLRLVRDHKVSTIAIGNGTACREVETLVSGLISQGAFSPLSPKYTIVSEQGASIYSCSSLAQKEFPGIDTNIVSAISIGRRLQDPLSELVKIEPQHLGVGMYQHDLTQAKLKTSLDQVVVECVSFVGVDLNSCSPHLLRRVAGLNIARADAIVAWRTEKGGFKDREELQSVKGIGAKVFLQCAGFLRVRSQKEPLDSTQIHPESYKVSSLLRSFKKTQTPIPRLRAKL